MTTSRNPYLIEGPALISFSGGRTSAYMLPSGARFVTEYSYATLLQTARDQGHLFDGWMDEEHDVECGLLCAAE